MYVYLNFINTLFPTSNQLWEFPGGLAVKGSGIVTAVAQVTAVAGVQSLAWELTHVANATPPP